MDNIIKFIGYALAVWIAGGLILIDSFLILDLLKQPTFLWWHLGAIWIVAFGNIIFIFLATICYGAAKEG